MRHSDIRLTTKTYTDASLLPTADAMETLPRWDMPVEQAEVKTGTDDAVSGATVRATVLPSFKVTLVPQGSLAMGNGDTHESRMDSEESSDYQGVYDAVGKFRGVGIEPTTKGL